MTGSRKTTGDQIEAGAPALQAQQPDDIFREHAELMSAQVERVREVMLDHLSHDSLLFNQVLNIREALLKLPPERLRLRAEVVLNLTQHAIRGLEARQVQSPHRRAEFQRRIDGLNAAGYAAASDRLKAAAAKAQPDDETVESLKRKKFRGSGTTDGKLPPDDLQLKEKNREPIPNPKLTVQNDSIEARLRALEEFSIENRGYGTADYVRENFPELGAKSLDGAASLHPQPEVAPIKWKDREPGETPPDFVRRAYGPWLEGGLSKRALRSLDPTLITELNKWVREGNEMPADIKILTLSEENSVLLDAGPDVVREHLGKFTAQEAIREAARLRSAQQRRK